MDSRWGWDYIIDLFVMGTGRLTGQTEVSMDYDVSSVVIWSECREQVEGMGLYAGDKRNEKSVEATQSKCVNDRENSVTERMQEAEIMIINLNTWVNHPKYQAVHKRVAGCQGV